jgi:hypothetical protein
LGVTVPTLLNVTSALLIERVSGYDEKLWKSGTRRFLEKIGVGGFRTSLTWRDNYEPEA